MHDELQLVESKVDAMLERLNRLEAIRRSSIPPPGLHKPGHDTIVEISMDDDKSNHIDDEDFYTRAPWTSPLLRGAGRGRRTIPDATMARSTRRRPYKLYVETSVEQFSGECQPDKKVCDGDEKYRDGNENAQRHDERTHDRDGQEKSLGKVENNVTDDEEETTERGGTRMVLAFRKQTDGQI